MESVFTTRVLLFVNKKPSPSFAEQLLCTPDTAHLSKLKGNIVCSTVFSCVSCCVALHSKAKDDTDRLMSTLCEHAVSEQCYHGAVYQLDSQLEWNKTVAKHYSTLSHAAFVLDQ